MNVNIPNGPTLCKHLVGGEWVYGEEKNIFGVVSPYNGKIIGYATEADENLINEAIKKANEAFKDWKKTPIKERCQVLFRYRELMLKNIEELSHIVASESGKTLDEAKAGIMKGLEVTEFAVSLQNMDQGASMEVSRGVYCQMQRDPLGVVCGITPFNFPAMVPMWMFPIALALGNSFVMKPSEKVPLTAQKMAEYLMQAGLPKGVFTILNGKAATSQAIIDHPLVKAVAFVGSTPVAKSVYQKATLHGKRSIALGGAKNPIILTPDADPSIAVRGIVDSFTGCAGQRCMAASILLAVGDVDHIIEKIKEEASKIVLSRNMGAIIDDNSLTRIMGILGRAEAEGAKIVLDGRSPAVPEELKGGYWLGPTIIDDVKPDMECARTEIFGPVIAIIRVDNLSQAMAIESVNSFGNATSVFTSSGAVARHVATESQSGMIGINIGVPVPREPFSFGGTKDSKFGACDITGESSLEFWGQLKKITTKWSPQQDENWMS